MSTIYTAIYTCLYSAKKNKLNKQKEWEHKLNSSKLLWSAVKCIQVQGIVFLYPKCLSSIACMRCFFWLHQRASVTLSRHHDSNGSHACQSRGTNLWRHSKQWWHLRLSPFSPVGNGNQRAP